MNTSTVIQIDGTNLSSGVVELSGKDFQEGAILSYHQKSFIRKNMTEIAQELLNLDYDPLNPHNFVQQQSSLKGQLQFAQFLLDASVAAEQMALDESKAVQSSQ